MVRKPAGNIKKIVGAGGDPTDGRDPAYQDLYIPRKEGDSTGQSQVVNDLAQDLSAPGSEMAAVNEQVNMTGGRPLALGEPTRFANEANTAGITLGAGPGPSRNLSTEVSLQDWVTGALKKYDSPILAELLENLRGQEPVVENNKDQIDIVNDKRYPTYDA
tara:strand:- start:959 stop:1441 length:483 start_codon:yes stop_codon:yes gene_type:complete